MFSFFIFLDTWKQLALNQKHPHAGSLTSSWESQEKYRKTTNGKRCRVTMCRRSTESITSSAFIPTHKTPTSKVNCRSSDTITTSRRSSHRKWTTTSQSRISPSLPAARRTAARAKWRLQVRGQLWNYVERHTPCISSPLTFLLYLTMFLFFAFLCRLSQREEATDGVDEEERMKTPVMFAASAVNEKNPFKFVLTHLSSIRRNVYFYIFVAPFFFIAAGLFLSLSFLLRFFSCANCFCLEFYKKKTMFDVSWGIPYTDRWCKVKVPTDVYFVLPQAQQLFTGKKKKINFMFCWLKKN